MKKLLLPFALLALFFLGCTKTEYEEIIKYIDRPGPTQFIATSTETECKGIDTLSLSIEIKQNGAFDKDTLMHLSTACQALIKIRGYVLVPKETIVVPGDSVPYPVPYPVPGDSIPYPVYDTIWQTVYDRTVIYHDTAFVSDADHPTSWVPSELTPFMSEFQDEAFKRNKVVNGMPIIVQYVHPEDLPGDSWVSFSYHFGNQYVIQVTESLPTEYLYSAMFRELARLELVPRKKYSSDPNKIMCNLFDPFRLTTNSPDKKQYLDVLFN